MSKVFFANNGSGANDTQVAVAAFRKWHLKVHEESTLLYETGNKHSTTEGSRKLEHSDELKCLDKATIVSDAETKGMMMDSKIGSFTIPPASLSTFDVIRRTGIGLFISCLCMPAAAMGERERLQLVKELDLVDKQVVAPISIHWKIPQYFLLGAAEVCTFIGKLEFFYNQSPDAVRSLCSAPSNYSIGQLLEFVYYDCCDL
ncbi:hypothetical protein V6N13_114312 [Hibiscus sabdariffa]